MRKRLESTDSLLSQSAHYDQVFSTEPITAMNVPDMISVEGGFVISDKWKSEWNQPLQVIAHEVHKDTQFALTEDPPLRAPFVRPKQNIVTPRRSALASDIDVEYSCDLVDLEWLRKFNRQLPSSSLSPSEMEAVVDRLEKDSFYFFNTHSRVFEAVRSNSRKRRATASEILTAFQHSSEPLPRTADGFVARHAPKFRPGDSLQVNHAPLPTSTDPLELNAYTAAMSRPWDASELRASVSVPMIARRLRLPELSVACVAEHWNARRSVRHSRPLMRRFHKPSPKEYLAARHLAPRHRHALACAMRFKLEKLRTISHMLCRREELKRDLVNNLHATFERQCLAKIRALPPRAQQQLSDFAGSCTSLNSESPPSTPSCLLCVASSGAARSKKGKVGVSVSKSPTVAVAITPILTAALLRRKRAAAEAADAVPPAKRTRASNPVGDPGTPTPVTDGRKKTPGSKAAAAEGASLLSSIFDRLTRQLWRKSTAHDSDGRNTTDVD